MVVDRKVRPDRQGGRRPGRRAGGVTGSSVGGRKVAEPSVGQAVRRADVQVGRRAHAGEGSHWQAGAVWWVAGRQEIAACLAGSTCACAASSAS
jgi:hypothetical protein